MELLELYRRSLAELTCRVPQVAPDQWHGPTPCPEWDVWALINHLVYEERWSAPLFAGATIADVGDRFDGDLLGNDPVGTVGDATAQTEAAIAEPGALDRTVHLSFGEVPGTEYVWQLLAEHLVHSWDLAVAIGADPHLDPDAVRACAEWFTGRELMYRMAGAIGPRVEVPAGSAEQDRLLGAFGRDPRWSAKG